MKLLGASNERNRFQLPILTLAIVFIGLFHAVSVRSEVSKKPPSNQSPKVPIKLVKSVVEYAQETLNLTIKSINVMNEAENLTQKMKSGSEKESEVKNIKKARKFALKAKLDATERLKGMKNALKKLESAKASGGDSSKEAMEALAEAVRSVNETGKAMKDQKFSFLAIPVMIGVQVLTGFIKKKLKI